MFFKQKLLKLPLLFLMIYTVINSINYSLNIYFVNTQTSLKFEDYILRLFIGYKSNKEYIDFSDPFLFLGIFTILVIGFIFVSFQLKEINQFSLLRFKKFRSLFWVYYFKALIKSFIYVIQLPIYIFLSLLIINFNSLNNVETKEVLHFLMYAIKLIFFFISLSQLSLFLILYKERSFATYFTLIFIMIIVGLDIYIPVLNLILYNSGFWFFDGILFWAILSVLVSIIGNTILSKKGINFV